MSLEITKGKLIGIKLVNYIKNERKYAGAWKVVEEKSTNFIWGKIIHISATTLTIQTFQFANPRDCDVVLDPHLPEGLSSVDQFSITLSLLFSQIYEFYPIEIGFLACNFHPQAWELLVEQGD